MRVRLTKFRDAWPGRDASDDHKEPVDSAAMFLILMVAFQGCPMYCSKS